MRRWFFPACVCATFILLACGVPGFAVAGSSEDLIEAIGAGDLPRVQKLLEEGASPDSRDEEGVPALTLAAGAPDTAILQVLVGAKASLEARDSRGNTALMFAAEGGRYEAARLLLDAGAEVDALEGQKASPLMCAAQYGYDDVIALLVERGADVNRKAAQGVTALDIAKQSNQELTVGLLENGGRQKPPVPEFQMLRPYLYQDSPIEALFLNVAMDDKTFEAARQLAVKGELQKARDILEAGREELQGQPLYRWALAYLQMKLGEREAALSSLRKLLTTPALGSRETLRIWKLMRDLGEAPSSSMAKQVLGVVVEMGLGPSVLAVAAYDDGQPRFFLSQGGGIIGEEWTAEETQKVHEIVGLARDLVDGMTPTEDQELPKPGRVRFNVLTPGGSYSAEESFALLNRGEGRFVKVLMASDQLFGMLYKHAQDQKEKEGLTPAAPPPPPGADTHPPAAGTPPPPSP